MLEKKIGKLSLGGGGQMSQRVNGAVGAGWEHLHTITSCKTYIPALTEQVQNMPYAAEGAFFPCSLYNAEQSSL